MKPVIRQKVDARKLSKNELLAQRKLVISLYQEGMRVMQIVDHTGLSWGAVNVALKLFRTEGLESLKPASRGRKLGTGRILSLEQEAKICELIRRRGPWYYGLKQYSWRLKTVIELIDEKCGIQLSDRSARNYLYHWGIQLPASNRSSKPRKHLKVPSDLSVNAPNIEGLTKEEDSEVFRIHAPVRIDKPIWRLKALREKPLADDAQVTRKQRLTMLAASTNQGELHWIIVSGRITFERQLQLIKCLIKDTRKKKLILVYANAQNARTDQLMEKLRRESLTKEVRFLPAET